MLFVSHLATNPVGGEQAGRVLGVAELIVSHPSVQSRR